MDDEDASIANNFPVQARRSRVVLGFTLVLLCLGMIAPIVTMKKFVLIENTFSVLGGMC